MNIGDVERRTKVSKKTIRFYEEQELIKPKRAENGYRVYDEEDIRALEEIKFLRDLSIPLEDIRRIRDGRITLSDAIESHIRKITEEQEKLERIKETGKLVASENRNICDMDLSKYEKTLEGLEVTRISTIEEYNKKAVKSSNLAAILFILVFVVLFIGLILIKMGEPDFPTWVLVMIEIFVAFPIVGTIVAMIQRKKEILRGEIFDAEKY